MMNQTNHFLKTSETEKETCSYAQPTIINTMETPLDVNTLYVIIPKGPLPDYSGNIMIIGKYYIPRYNINNKEIPEPSTKRETLWFDYVLAYREIQDYVDKTKRYVQERQETIHFLKNDVDIYLANDVQTSIVSCYPRNATEGACCGLCFNDYRRNNLCEETTQKIRNWVFRNPQHAHAPIGASR
jgi:hypothetical protein